MLSCTMIILSALAFIIEVNCLQHPLREAAHKQHHGIGMLGYILLHQPCSCPPAATNTDAHCIAIRIKKKTILLA